MKRKFERDVEATVQATHIEPTSHGLLREAVQSSSPQPTWRPRFSLRAHNERQGICADGCRSELRCVDESERDGEDVERGRLYCTRHTHRHTGEISTPASWLSDFGGLTDAHRARGSPPAPAAMMLGLAGGVNHPPHGPQHAYAWLWLPTRPSAATERM